MLLLVLYVIVTIPLSSVLSSALSIALSPTLQIKHHKSWSRDTWSRDLQDLSEAIHELDWKYYTTDDGINWQIDFNEVLAAPLTDRIARLVGVERSGLVYENVTARLLRRGDDVKISRVCKGQGDVGTVALLAVRVPQDRNDYSELLFFDDVISDVISTIRPGKMSVISFPCTQHYQWQYPAIQTQQGLYFLQFVFIQHGAAPFSPITNQVRHFPRADPYTRLPDTLTFPLTNSFNLSDTAPVYVLDALFPAPTLRHLAAHFLHHSSYLVNEEDDGGGTDNVISLTPVHIPHFTATHVWGVMERAVTLLTGHRGWYPYDVSNNLNEPWDHTRIHPDCDSKEEYTLLLYLNEDYCPGDLGGTVWYAGPAGDRILGSVMNKFGRLAIFQCGILHAARPPHAYKPGPRLTLAVKVSASKEEAVARTKAEKTVEGEEDEDELQEQFLREIREQFGGKVDEFEKEFYDWFDGMKLDYQMRVSKFLKTVGRQPVRDEL